MRNNQILFFDSLDEFKESITARKTVKIDAKPASVDFIYEGGEIQLCKTDIFGGFKLPIRETALTTILQRAKVSGIAFRMLSDAELTKVLQDLKRIVVDNNKSLVIMEVDGCVNSINSESYSHIPLTEILDEVEEVVQSYYKGELIVDIESSYELSNLKFLTDRKKYSFLNEEEKLTIGLRNSENGSSSCSIYANLGVMPVMAGMNIIHKNNADISNVKEVLSKLDNSISESIEKLKKLENIEITNKEFVTRTVARSAHLPEKYCNHAVGKINKRFPGETTPTNAGAIYKTLSEIVNNAVIGNETKDSYRNNLLKLISINWKSLDKGGIL